MRIEDCIRNIFCIFSKITLPLRKQNQNALRHGTVDSKSDIRFGIQIHDAERKSRQGYSQARRPHQRHPCHRGKKRRKDFAPRLFGKNQRPQDWRNRTRNNRTPKVVPRHRDNAIPHVPRSTVFGRQKG